MSVGGGRGLAPDDWQWGQTRLRPSCLTCRCRRWTLKNTNGQDDYTSVGFTTETMWSDKAMNVNEYWIYVKNWKKEVKMHAFNVLDGGLNWQTDITEILTWSFVDISGEQPISCLLCIRTSQVKLTKVGHIKHSYSIPAGQTLVPNLEWNKNVKMF